MNGKLIRIVGGLIVITFGLWCLKSGIFWNQEKEGNITPADVWVWFPFGRRLGSVGFGIAMIILGCGLIYAELLS